MGAYKYAEADGRDKRQKISPDDERKSSSDNVGFLMMRY